MDLDSDSDDGAVMTPPPAKRTITSTASDASRRPPPASLYRSAVSRPNGTITKDPCLFTDPSAPNVKFLARALMDASIIPDCVNLMDRAQRYIGAGPEKGGSKKAGDANRDDDDDTSLDTMTCITLQREEDPVVATTAPPVATLNADDDNDNDDDMTVKSVNRGSLRFRLASNTTYSMFDAILPVNYVDKYAPYGPPQPYSSDDQPPSIVVEGGGLLDILLCKAKDILSFCKDTPSQVPVVQIIPFEGYIDIAAIKQRGSNAITRSDSCITTVSTDGQCLSQSPYQLDPACVPPGISRDEREYQFALPISHIAGDICVFLKTFAALSSKGQFANGYVKITIRTNPLEGVVNFTLVTRSTRQPETLSVTIPLKTLDDCYRATLTRHTNIGPVNVKLAALRSMFDFIPSAESARGELFMLKEHTSGETDLDFLFIRYIGHAVRSKAETSTENKGGGGNDDNLADGKNSKNVEEANADSLDQRRPWEFYYVIRTEDEEVVRENLASAGTTNATDRNPMWNFAHTATTNMDGDIMVRTTPTTTTTTVNDNHHHSPFVVPRNL